MGRLTEEIFARQRRTLLVLASAAACLLLSVRLGRGAAERPQIEAVAVAPSETLPVSAPGHWWEARILYSPSTRGLDGHIEVLTPWVLNGRFELIRPVRIPPGQSGVLRVPMYWPAGRSGFGNSLLRLATRDGEVVAVEEVALGNSMRYVIGLVARTPFPFPSLGRSRARAPVLGPFALAIPTRTGPQADRQNEQRAAEPGATDNSGLPLPHHPGCWSGISHIIMEPSLIDALSTSQSRGLITWLHWGGTLVLSGGVGLPRQISPLLGPYAAGTWDRPTTFVLRAGEEGEPVPQLEGERSVLQLTAQSLVPRPGARVLLRDAAGQALALERIVGRGRLVQVAIDLNDRALEDFRGTPTLWVKLLLGTDVGLQERLPGGRLTRVRFIARDVTGARSQQYPATTGFRSPLDDAIQQVLYGTIAGADRTARTVTAAALGLYVAATLVVHALALRRRRLWNWVVIPLFSLATAMGLVVAGVGLKGSWSELVLVETFPDLPAAHVTRHIQLRTAMRQEVDIVFRNRWTLPVPKDTEREPRAVRALPGLGIARIALEPTRLAGLVCYARTPRHVQAEQYEFPTTPYFTVAPDGAENGLQLINQSPWHLSDVVLYDQLRATYLTASWPQGERLTLTYRRAEETKKTSALIGQLVGRVQDERVRPIYQLLLTNWSIPGALVVGWSVDCVPGPRLSPRLDKSFERSIVVIALGEYEQVVE